MTELFRFLCGLMNEGTLLPQFVFLHVFLHVARVVAAIGVIMATAVVLLSVVIVPLPVLVERHLSRFRDGLRGVMIC